MKKILLIVFICMLLIPVAFSQSGVHFGGRFSKNIEYNILHLGPRYNLTSKGDVEKLFFGDFNAPAEFFHEPSFEGASGFRIVRDTLKKSYILEIKYISNYKDASNTAWEKYPMRGVYSLSTIPKDTLDEIRKQNRENIEKAFEEMNNLFKVESRFFLISDLFAEKLYEKLFFVIDNFKAKGVPPTINDGYSVTFRTVVDDEVWSLKVHMPKGIALKFSDICIEIINKALDSGKIDEIAFIKLLDDF